MGRNLKKVNSINLAKLKPQATEDGLPKRVELVKREKLALQFFFV